MKKSIKTGAQIQFEKLPIRLKRKILKRIKQHYNKNYADFRKRIFSQNSLILTSCFVWDETFEGFHYWNKIERKYNLVYSKL